MENYGRNHIRQLCKVTEDFIEEKKRFQKQADAERE